VLVKLLTGFVIAHVLWAYFFTLGSLALELMGPAASEGGEAEKAGLEIVVRTALGASIGILVLFLLGIAGQLRSPAIGISALLIPSGLILLLWRSGIRPIDTAKDIGATMKRGIDWGWLTVYLIALALAPPVLLAPADWDSTMYHLAHAIDWGRTGVIFVEPYVRYPLFAYNFELLYALFFALHLDPYVQLPAWLSFAWSATGVYSFSQFMLRRQTPQGIVPAPIVRFVPLAAALVYCTSPVVLRYADIAYVEVAIGFFFLAFVSASVLALTNFRRYAGALAAIAGCFVGMKLPLISFTVLVISLILYVGKKARVNLRSIALALLLFAIAGSPWYLRNLFIAGDPISPILNLAFKGTDPYWSKTDYAGIMSALRQGHTSVVLAPFLFFLKPATFEEFGSSFNVCFLLLPVPLAAMFVIWRRFRARNPEMVILCAACAYAVCVIYVVSPYVGRYILAFYAAYIVLLATTLWTGLISLSTAMRLGRNAGTYTAAVSIAALLILSIPSPLSEAAYAGYLSMLPDLDKDVQQPGRYLSRVPGYTEESDIATVVAGSRQSGTVLAVGFENLAYYFRERGVVSIGDWVGPARYSDLASAVDHNHLETYLNHFHVLGVIIRAENHGLTKSERDELAEALPRDGFRNLTRLGSPVREFVRSDVLRKAAMNGLRVLAPVIQDRRDTVDLINAFDRGRINNFAHASTPTGRGALTLAWPSEAGTYDTLTVLAQYAYTFPNLSLRRGAQLEFAVAKVHPIGLAAVAWIDMRTSSGTRRIFSVTCPPATGPVPGWRQVVVPLRAADGPVSLTFGADSVPGGGTADWIAFAHPTLTHASFAAAR
jgi:hypothetical protein